MRLVGGSLPFLAPLFLQTALGFSPAKAGIALLPMGIASMFAKSVVNALLVKFGYKKFLILNTLLLSAFIFMISSVNLHTPYYMILILFSFVGMANSLQFTALNTLALIDVPDNLISGANSMMSVVMQISMAMGVALSAFLLAQTAALTIPAVYSGQKLLFTFHLTYKIISIISVAGAFIFIFIKKDAGTHIKDIDAAALRQ